MKKIYLIGICIIMLIMFSSIVSSHDYVPLNYYKFDDNYTDSGSSSHDLTDYNSPSFVNAIVNNGTYINTNGYAENLTYTNAASIRTIDCWAKFDLVDSNNHWVVAIDAGDTVDRLYVLLSGENKWQVKLEVADVVKFDEYTSGSVLSVGTWYNFVLRMGVGGMNFTVDGAALSSNTATDVMTADFDEMHIGKPGYTSNGYMDGTVDNCAFFEERYTDADVTWSYNAGSGREFQTESIPEAGILTTNLISPINNDVDDNFFQNFTFNYTLNNESLAENCELHTNETGSFGFTANLSTGLSPNTTLNISHTFGSDGVFIWNVACNVSGFNSTFASSNFTLTLDTVPPEVSTDFVNGSIYYLDNLTGVFNFSDNNLLHNINFIIDDDRIFNVTHIHKTTYQVNLSHDIINITTGLHNLTVTFSDGHTAKKLKNINDWSWSNGLLNDYLKFEWDNDYKLGEIIIKSKTSSIFDNWEAIENYDRFNFIFEPNTPSNTYEFLIETSFDYYLYEDQSTDYKKWMVIDEHWVDFYLGLGETINFEPQGNGEVLVTLTNVPIQDSYEFKSIGDLNVVQVNYSFFRINTTESYETSVLTGYNTTLSLNISGIINYSYIPTLQWNFTNYTSTESFVNNDSIYEVVILAPEISETQNKSHKWYFNITTEETTDLLNQTIYDVILDNCTDSETLVLNFTVRNETNENLITSDIDVTFFYNINEITKNYSVGMSERSNFDFCLNPSFADITSDIALQYSAIGYEVRDWIKQNYNIDNQTDNITLYLLTTGESTEVNVEVVDENDDDLASVVIEVYKYAIDTNSYKLVSSETTDSEGRAQFQLAVGSTYYQFKFFVDNELKLTSSTFKITNTDLKYVISDIISSPIVDLLKARNISGTMSYINDSQTFSFEWDDVSSYASGITFEVSDGNSTVFLNTSTDTTGIMSFTVTELNKTYTAVGSATVSNRKYTLDSLSINLRDFWRQFGFTQSLIMSMLIILTLGLIGIKSPQLCIVMSAIGMIAVFFIGMLPIGFKAVISVGAVGLILLSLMKERYYQ